jgi:hypothetical protein
MIEVADDDHPPQVVGAQQGHGVAYRGGSVNALVVTENG